MRDKAARTARWYLVLALLLGAVGPLAAQPTSTEKSLLELKGFLVGPDWVYIGWSYRMGNERVCDAGGSWRFFGDGVLELRECAEGKVVTQKSHWRPELKDNGQWFLHVDGKVYKAELLVKEPERPGLAGARVLKLRTIRERQRDPVLERVFEAGTL